ncbi:sulfurtransferase [Anaerolineales bacterium HSG6]|nr:sulfurtransferase [Anaerolineales bacterium HSG6]MDM8532506.1 sulfurtransferase [Anaerolineales bacterium HSG25]
MSYAKPDVLISTQWVQDNLDSANIRILESNENILLYDTGHIEGALKIDWMNELNDPIIRDYLDAKQFAQLMSKKGISNDTTVVLYGDKNNWWATYTFWVFQLFGHTNTKIMDGGRSKWIEEGRPLTKDKPTVSPTAYSASTRNDSEIRAYRKDVLAHIEKNGTLADVRSPAEYSGELLHMADYPQEGSLRGGHIKGARNIPWVKAANADGTFKSYEMLKVLYETEGVTPDKEIVTYCRIGERSSHSWFVLTYLLGYKNVRNYDGSWTEWGNSVGLPIER